MHLSGFLLLTSTVCSVVKASCRPNPCKHSGDCTVIADGYNCTCKPGYTGNDCENTYCNPNPCENGGECTYSVVGYTCACLPGFTGKKCEANVQDATAESSLPPRSTEESSATMNDTVSSTPSGSVLLSVTCIKNLIISTPSSNFVAVSATFYQTTSFPTFRLAALSSNIVTSQWTGPSSSNFFDKEINIAVVASLGGILTVILSLIASYYFATRKSKNAIHHKNLRRQKTENS